MVIHFVEPSALSEIGGAASEETILTLLIAKCIQILLYATEAFRLLSHEKYSIEFAITRLFMNAFKT